MRTTALRAYHLSVYSCTSILGKYFPSSILVYHKESLAHLFVSSLMLTYRKSTRSQYYHCPASTCYQSYKMHWETCKQPPFGYRRGRSMRTEKCVPSYRLHVYSHLGEDIAPRINKSPNELWPLSPYWRLVYRISKPFNKRSPVALERVSVKPTHPSSSSS